MGLDQARLEGEEYYQVGSTSGLPVQGLVELTALACPTCHLEFRSCLAPVLAAMQILLLLWQTRLHTWSRAAGAKSRF